MTNKQIERFWEKVEKTEGCWNWTAAKKHGYGSVKWGGRMRIAHRIAFEIECGSIPEGMQVCHHCDNPACVRPSHLFLGTQKDNMRDMIVKGRQARPPATKLTWADAQVIREAPGLHREIAARFGISRPTVSEIKAGSYWKTEQYLED
jgi:hypothetical protein